MTRILRSPGLRPQNAGVVYALVALVAVFAILCAATGRPPYLSAPNTAGILDQAAQVGILAIFMTVVLISGNFDLSVAATAALAGGVTIAVVDDSGLLVGLLAGVGVGVVVGTLNGLLVELVGINAFIVTLGTMTAVRGVLLIATDGESIQGQSSALSDLALGQITVDLRVMGIVAGLALAVVAVLAARRRASSGWMALGATGIVVAAFAAFLLPSSWPATRQVLVMLALAALTWAVLRHTVVGRRLYAVGGNPEAARLSGIPVRRYRIVPFLLTGFGAAITGIFFAASFGSVSPTSLQGLELTVLAAAILGGTSLFGGIGSVVKSLVGALILTVLANGFSVMNLGANYQQLIQGVVIVGAAASYVIAERRSRRTSRPERASSNDAAREAPRAQEESLSST
jgi:D-xylose transport system permease protein